MVCAGAVAAVVAPVKDMRVHCDGNLVFSGGRLTSWWRLAPARWNWMSEQERDGMILASAQVFAGLVGHRLHIRGTSTALTAEQWADRVAAGGPQALQAYEGHRRLQADHLVKLDMHEKACYVGVDLAKGSAAVAMWAGLWGSKSTGDIEPVVAGPGWDARKATPSEIEWLFRRAYQLGHPSPRAWPMREVALREAFDELAEIQKAAGVPPTRHGMDVSDMAEITRSAQWAAEPYGRSVKIVRDGEVRHVVVSVVGQMAPLDSQAGPWLCTADRLPYPVELSATVDVIAPEATKTSLRAAIMRARAQGKHYTDDHDQPPPQGLQAGIDRALDVEKEIAAGFTGTSTRVFGWFRLLVAHEDEGEAVRRAKEIAELYQPLIKIERPAGQYALAREFAPGARQALTAYKRIMNVIALAAGMPQATATVGHRAGFYLGWTAGAGGRHAAMWDPWWSMEKRERSGLTAVVGQPGSGKSSLTASTAYQAALAGVPTTVLDPSGPMAALCRLPELAGRAKHVDLLSAAPGILNPRRLIPVPARWAHPGTDAEYAHEVELANTTARTLCTDVLMEMLPPIIRDQPGTLIAVRDACRQAVLAHPHDWSPRHVLLELRVAAAGKTSWADQSQVCADLLSDLATLPAAQLIFDTGDPQLDAAEEMAVLAGGAPPTLLTVITMNGLTLPREGADRRDMSTDEILSLPLLHLAAWLVQRTVYHGDRSARKLVCFDEVHALTRIGAGRLLLNTSARDSRKHNARVILASQNAADLLEAGVANLVDCAFVMRTEDPEAQAEALKLLHVGQGVGFEAALGTLSQHARSAAGRSGYREAVWSDGLGGCERIVLDQSHFPAHVRAALETTPDPDGRPESNGKVAVLDGAIGSGM